VRFGFFVVITHFLKVHPGASGPVVFRENLISLPESRFPAAGERRLFMEMELRDAVHPEHARRLDTEGLRRHFLIGGLFPADGIRLVYSAYDRLIVGGCAPARPLELAADKKSIGADRFLERRELGVVNIGAPGTVTVDGKRFDLGPRDALYAGMGAEKIVFESADPKKPARFYFNSVPAHHAWPTVKVSEAAAARAALGEADKCNRRTINKYIHPDGVRSCQLVMGLTRLEPGSVWNTMPVHTHARRVEAYLYFDLAEKEVVFHVLGEPGETRHLVVRNGEAVLHPSWSIHAGAGTRSYSFIWGMAGENQTFSDMDEVPMTALR
jgi:4-deoxy-L-threo-5-hexosulose-uronate ketol-isomerase